MSDSAQHPELSTPERADHSPRQVQRFVPMAHSQAAQHTHSRAGDFVNLNDVGSRLRASRWILVAGALLGLAAAVAISALVKPIYRAHTTVRLEQLTERFPNLPDLTSAEPSSASETMLQNELRVIESDSLAKRVADKLAIEPKPVQSKKREVRIGGLLVPMFLRPAAASGDDDQINQVQQALTVRPSLKSQVIELSYDAPDPDFAAKAANAVVSEYIAMNREDSTEAARDRMDWLARQISDLKDKLDKGNAELQAFATSSGLVYGTNQNLLTAEKAGQVQEELGRAQADRAAKQANYDAAISNPLDALPNSADGGMLRESESKLSAAQTEVLQLRGLYTSSHYKVVEAEARVAQLQDQVKVERERIVARMRAELDAARRREDTLAGSYGADSQKLSAQTAAAFHYEVLKRDLESTEVLYNSLLQKTKEAGVTSAMSAVTVRVIDPARPPSLPRSPNLPLNSSVGFATGLLLSAGLVLAKSRDNYVDARAVEWNELGIRSLGAIPYAKRSFPISRSTKLLGDDGGKKGVELVTWYEQPSDLTEAFRAAITSIVFSPGLPRKKHLVLTVTSVRPQEGKTTAVSNLGVALAETHGRVLLIDADLRRPRMHEIFGHCNDTGLSTLLSSNEPPATMPLEGFIRQTSIPGLFVLPSGPGAASIPPLLFSQRMPALLERLRKEYDFVLIDTPPASLFADARVLGRQSDGLLLVVHGAKITRSEFAETCQNLLQDGTTVLGTILNRCNSNPRNYDVYRYNRS